MMSLQDRNLNPIAIGSVLADGNANLEIGHRICQFESIPCLPNSNSCWGILLDANNSRARRLAGQR